MVYCISKIFGNNWSSMSNTFNERTLVIFLNYLLSIWKANFQEARVFQSLYRNYRLFPSRYV